MTSAWRETSLLRQLHAVSARLRGALVGTRRRPRQRLGARQPTLSRVDRAWLTPLEDAMSESCAHYRSARSSRCALQIGVEPPCRMTDIGKPRAPLQGGSTAALEAHPTRF